MTVVVTHPHVSFDTTRGGVVRGVHRERGAHRSYDPFGA